ncbi:hypothetical protein C8R47DRAFT_1157617 [Mycena vitilis]|nr:hypothetical protein C8R47DRAFT_1157617 [Mycena vitilis]
MHVKKSPSLLFSVFPSVVFLAALCIASYLQSNLDLRRKRCYEVSHTIFRDDHVEPILLSLPVHYDADCVSHRDWRRKRRTEENVVGLDGVKLD